MATAARRRRIRGARVAPLFPDEGPVRVLLVGEAPGPRGADCSGIPFWGDRAGRLEYRALAEAGMASVPAAAWDAWDGARLTALGLRPSLSGAALTNALARCPTSDRRTFRAPTDRELRAPANLRRITDEIARARARCPSALAVVAFVGRAKWLLTLVADSLQEPKPILHMLPNPSAQGLLQAAPERGRGLRLADLEAAWMARLRAILVSAGASPSP